MAPFLFLKRRGTAVFSRKAEFLFQIQCLLTRCCGHLTWQRRKTSYQKNSPVILFDFVTEKSPNSIRICLIQVFRIFRKLVRTGCCEITKFSRCNILYLFTDKDRQTIFDFNDICVTENCWHQRLLRPVPRSSSVPIDSMNSESGASLRDRGSELSVQRCQIVHYSFRVLVQTSSKLILSYVYNYRLAHPNITQLLKNFRKSTFVLLPTVRKHIGMFCVVVQYHIMEDSINVAKSHLAHVFTTIQTF